MGGRPLKPTKMKVLQGTLRKDRTNPKEPEPTLLKIPSAPTVELNEWGMEEWKRSSVNLIECGVLTISDVSALSAMCYEFGEFVECGLEIKRVKTGEDLSGMTPEQRVRMMEIKFLSGKNLEKLRKEHLEAYCKLSMQFGLTPASRPKVNGTKKTEDDPFDAI